MNTIKYIDNGHLKEYKIHFYEYWKSIPIYVCNEIDRNILVKSRTDDIMIIINTTDNDISKLEMNIEHLMVSKHFDTDVASMADIAIKNKYGFNEAKHFIEERASINIKDRLSILENNCINSITRNCVDIDTILNEETSNEKDCK